MKKSFFAIFLSLFFLPNTLFAQNNNDFGKVEGYVRSNKNQAPIYNVDITLKGDTIYQTKSHDDGGYSFPNVKNGNYTLTASFENHTTFQQQINVSSYILVAIMLEYLGKMEEVTNLDEILVKGLRVGEENGMAYNNISQKELQKLNNGQDLPIMLNFQPSVVSTSDAGTGVGYTGLRIRGSDATRINVTVNGIPINDAESQGVFWVNMPDFVSSVADIQVQRGVGASTNGAGAFGASVNIKTNTYSAEPFAEINNSLGSFGTWKSNVKVGSGLINNKFAFEGRLSKVQSNGFIDRATADLRSFFLSGGYFGKKTMIKFNVFSGKEITYQAWNGVPEARLRNDLAGMQAYIDRNGLDAQDSQNLLQSNSRTFNSLLYKNEVDNYQQDHYQAFLTHQFNSNWDLNLAFHYTKGRGYYEQYRKDDKLATYNLDNVVIGNETIKRSDLIRRRWLDNDFYGMVFSLNYNKKNLDFSVGGGANAYKGKHFGEVIWAKYASNGTIGHRYYDNDATKNDINIYTKTIYRPLENLSLYADMQVRYVDYDFLGIANDAFGIRNVQQKINFTFFNPKAGITYQLDKKNQIYASLAVGNKEPNRDDFTQSSPESRPKAETLLDYEAGFRHESNSFSFQANGYFMDYQNQLILTGKVNDVGGYTRQNVKNSYRLGVELVAGYKILKNLTWQANMTLSQNKIKDFTEFTDDYDTGDQKLLQFTGTDIAFSPNLIAGSQLEYMPFKDFTIGFLNKYVGKQYLDNTSNNNRKLDAYFTQDIRLNYVWKPSFLKEINFNLLVNNIFNAQYENNGYTYGYYASGERTQENFYFPQAGTNFLMAVGVKF